MQQMKVKSEKTKDATTWNKKWNFHFPLKTDETFPLWITDQNCNWKLQIVCTAVIDQRGIQHSTAQKVHIGMSSSESGNFLNNNSIKTAFFSQKSTTNKLDLNQEEKKRTVLGRGEIKVLLYFTEMPGHCCGCIVIW